MEFFRHCPQCGRRFHIKLETKKLVTSHEESLPRREPSAMVVPGSSRGPGFSVSPGNIYAAASITPIEVQEGRPIIVEVEEFQYAYKCKHCGHEWSERHIEERRET